MDNKIQTEQKMILYFDNPIIYFIYKANKKGISSKSLLYIRSFDITKNLYE
jgi:hypothetical protein